MFGAMREVASNGSLHDTVAPLVEARSGKIAVTGRYHHLPTLIEDDYILSDSVLGSGLTGKVRMAKSKHFKGLNFAVKCLKLNNVSRSARDQLQSEVETFLAMDHPHVTRLYDVYETRTQLYLVMECMEGGELFDRVFALKRFGESDAAVAVRQMLRALNYIHSHGCIHRDVKLENFLYDKQGSDHLKIIDFGFSTTKSVNYNFASCGTLPYVAPEVLAGEPTTQCDLWSLGVVAFILLAGYMPFTGTEEVKMQKIKEADYQIKPVWGTVSFAAQEFTRSLLQKDPNVRMTAAEALEHRWLADPTGYRAVVDVGVLEALREFRRISKFRRCCMEMMAWSLSNEQRARVRGYFLTLDSNCEGTIKIGALKRVMEENFHITDEETKQIFDALDSNHDEEIHYSGFLAALMDTHIGVKDELLHSTFNKFDVDHSGYITVANMREVVGDTWDGERVETLIREADLLKDGRVSYEEFVAHMKGEPLKPKRVFRGCGSCCIPLRSLFGRS